MLLFVEIRRYYNMNMESTDDLTGGRTINVSVSNRDMLGTEDAIRSRIIELVAQQLAIDILENDYVQIVSKISPEAIANMAVAEAGAKINELLNSKLPDKIQFIEKNTTQVYQKGIFGNLRRVL